MSSGRMEAFSDGVIAIAYFILTRTLLSIHAKDSHLATALGADLKGKISVVIISDLKFQIPDLKFQIPDSGWDSGSLRFSLRKVSRSIAEPQFLFAELGIRYLNRHLPKATVSPLVGG